MVDGDQTRRQHGHRGNQALPVQAPLEWFGVAPAQRDEQQSRSDRQRKGLVGELRVEVEEARVACVDGDPDGGDPVRAADPLEEQEEREHQRHPGSADDDHRGEVHALLGDLRERRRHRLEPRVSGVALHNRVVGEEVPRFQQLPRLPQGRHLVVGD